MPNEKKRTWRHFSITRWIKWTLVLFLAMAVTTIVDMIDPVEPGKPLFEVSSTLRRFFVAIIMGLVFTIFIEPRQKNEPVRGPE